MRVLFKYKCGILLSGKGFMEKMKPFFVTKEKGTLSSSQIDKLYLSIKLGEMDIVFPRSFSILSPRDNSNSSQRFSFSLYKII